MHTITVPIKELYQHDHSFRREVLIITILDILSLTCQVNSSWLKMWSTLTMGRHLNGPTITYIHWKTQKGNVKYPSRHYEHFQRWSIVLTIMQLQYISQPTNKIASTGGEVKKHLYVSVQLASLLQWILLRQAHDIHSPLIRRSWIKHNYHRYIIVLQMQNKILDKAQSE